MSAEHTFSKYLVKNTSSTSVRLARSPLNARILSPYTRSALCLREETYVLWIQRKVA